MTSGVAALVRESDGAQFGEEGGGIVHVKENDLSRGDEGKSRGWR